MRANQQSLSTCIQSLNPTVYIAQMVHPPEKLNKSISINQESQNFVENIRKAEAHVLKPASSIHWRMRFPALTEAGLMNVLWR